MKTLRFVSVAGAALCAAFGARAYGAEAEPSPAAKMFGKKCGSCHTLGEGDRQGPDLLGVTQRREVTWLRTFIRTPSALLDGGDAIAADLLAKFKKLRMPDQTLTDAELDGLLAYLAECTAKGGCKLALGKVRHAADAKPLEVQAGRLLFEGTRPLQKGGASCLSCHNVRGAGILGGGTLAKDLTHAYARLGDAATHLALEGTAFPLMKDIYAKKPLSEAEVYELKAFLADTAKVGGEPPPDHNFLYLGVLGLLLSLGAIGFLWSGRMRGVRQTIVKRGNP